MYCVLVESFNLHIGPRVFGPYPTKEEAAQELVRGDWKPKKEGNEALFEKDDDTGIPMTARIIPLKKISESDL